MRGYVIAYLTKRKGTCRAVIETPKDRRNKFNYDPESNLFMLGRPSAGRHDVPV